MRGTQYILSLIFLGAMAFGSAPLGATTTSATTQKDLPICYIPGAGGGSTDAFSKFPQELEKRGIRFLTFDIGNVGTVVERAVKLALLMERELDKNPKFTCHFFAYSMGGPVSRYFYSHLELALKTGVKVDARSVMVSLSTFSSPHRGTPLADWLNRYAPRYAAGMDDLSEERMKAYNDPAFPETYSPVPTTIPVFSFLTFLDNADQTKDFLGKFGFKVIWQTYANRGLDPHNDGIIPFISQAVGKVAMTVKAPHGFFSNDLGLRPWAPDVFEAQYHSLNGSLDTLVKNGKLEALIASPRINTDDLGLDNLQLIY